MATPFNTRLLAEIERKGTSLCLGLDLDPGRDSPLHNSTLGTLRAAAASIVEATWAQVAAYKLNFAFFERHGPDGYAWLAELAAFIGDRALVIGDGKRGDIGNSARHYAEATFGALGMDAATVQPMLGRDSMEPFMADPAKGAFVLCLTSNPGADDFQRHPPGDPLFMRGAALAQNANRQNNLGLVVGATRPEDLASIRRAAPDLPFLMPGVGAQGGDLEAALSAGRPTAPVLIAVSRSVIYAGNGTLADITRAVAGYNAAIQAAAP